MAQLERGEKVDHVAAGIELGPIGNAFVIDENKSKAPK
jgi:hypothetical protein